MTTQTMSRDEALAALEAALPAKEEWGIDSVSMPVVAIRAVVEGDRGICGAGIEAEGAFLSLGPCTLSHGHPSAWHQERSGASWATTGAGA